MVCTPSALAPPSYTDLELPRWSCLPSHVALADFERLAPAVADMPDRLAPDLVPDQLAFRYGIDLFNAGFYWEAHEAWEPVWMALPPNSRERIACQALIQAANACLKLRFGGAKAFGRLAKEVMRHVSDATAKRDQVLAIDLTAWSAAFQSFADEVAAGRKLDYGFSPPEVERFPFLLLDSR